LSLKSKMIPKYKTDRGVAGLSVLLSVIVMLFVIGLLAMVFSLMGSKMRDATFTPTTITTTGEAVTSADFLNASKGYTLSVTTGLNNRGYKVVALYNNTNQLLAPSNYTLSGRVLKNATALNGLTNVRVNYTHIYDAENTATQVMNKTYSSVGGVTDWFNIFIVISAMVVLILLTVIIITAIRSSGMVAGVGAGDEVGTA
jgi:hypothetical protein